MYTIEIRRSESIEILQAISKNIYVTSIRHPTCKIMHVDGRCPLAEVTPTNCTFYKWFAMTETTYSSIAISSVTLSNTDSYTKITTGNTSSLYGPLATNVSGTCCTDIIDLRVLDTDGYIATCRLNFRYKGPDPNVVSDVKNDTTKGDDYDNSKTVVIVVGVSAAVLVVIVIVIKLVVNHIRSLTKVKDRPYASPKATDNVKPGKFDPNQIDGKLKTLA